MAQPQVDQQEKYLREATHHFVPLEKPLSYGPVVETMPQLIAALHREFETDHVNIEMVNHLMMAYKSNPKDWQKFAKFDRFKYTRNLVDAGNGRFNLMILCWGEGQGSAIHDHADSHCMMKMLQGELVETRYAMPKRCAATDAAPADIGQQVIDATGERTEDETQELQVIGQKSMLLNDVVYINDQIGLHRVENPSHSDTAVSLHLYCPPYDKCAVYQKNSGRKMECKVTFWSRYGERTNEE